MKSLMATGSISDHAQKMHSDIATAFTDVQLILLCDRSGSMAQRDINHAEGYKARYTVEDEIIGDLQKKYEGKLLIASFSDYALIHPDGNLPQPGGGTEIKKALEKIRPYMVSDIRVILISDGEPSDDERQIIAYAVSHYLGQLDCMFAGPPNSGGEKFLKELALACRGQFQTNILNQQHLLTDRVCCLLTA